MVEKGLGISIMPELILKRTPYNIVTKELNVPAFGELGFAVRDKKTVSLAVKKFMEYLEYRDIYKMSTEILTSLLTFSVF